MLVGKLQSFELPDWVLKWTIDFLTNRQHRVKLPDGVLSDWSFVPAGVPEGTKLGPWLYILMINNVNADNTCLWKYVDDITACETFTKGSVSNMQAVINEIHDQSKDFRFTLNEDKYKEMMIQFAKAKTHCCPLTVH